MGTITIKVPKDINIEYKVESVEATENLLEKVKNPLSICKPIISAIKTVFYSLSGKKQFLLSYQGIKSNFQYLNPGCRQSV
jgi:hypothetical protein